MVPPDPDTSLSTGAVEWVKLCHSSLQGDDITGFWAKRAPGFILPSIPHGSNLTISNCPIQIPEGRTHTRFIELNQVSEVKYEIGVPRMSLGFLSKYDESSMEAVDEIAFRLFGFKAMRSFQHEILGRVLSGRSILGIAATGGGKSECYILPAMLFPGVTIVISPLKSLMQDQYDKRIDERYGLKNLTTYINGDVLFAERQARLKRIELGYYKLVYFTPEQIRQPHVLNSLKRAHESVGIRYLTLDEAHCISQWGHDFRDSYLNLVTRLSNIGIEPVRIALTATASPEVRSDLCEELHLINEPLASGGDVYVHSSNRVELNLIVKPVHSTEAKVSDIIERLQHFLQKNSRTEKPDAAIVFMPWTGTDPDIPSWYLPENNAPSSKGRYSAGVTNFGSYVERSLNTRVAIYHGKMDFDKDSQQSTPGSQLRLGDLRGRSRRDEQSAFIEGQYPIMVATKGFGMGIDKPNIRLIIHRTPTSNLEAYAQEAGRAGRDGQISDVVLYYSPDSAEDGTTKVCRDYDIQDFFLTEKYIRRDDVIAMKQFLATVNREICDHLYFTSDEILPFFDRLASQGCYAWPSFPPRLPRGQESSEHKVILDRGHIYKQKIRYIDRILSALYRIRPDIGAFRRVCILDAVQDVGSVLLCNSVSSIVINADGIITSNAYFGELLRSRRVTASDFRTWMRRCISEDIIPFARALGLSLANTVSMLWDINRSDGQLKNGRWMPSLLDFKYVATPKYGIAQGLTVSEWRTYAGALRRANVTEARWRAEQARARGDVRNNNIHGQIVPSDDDWFGPGELPEPKGWEVHPGHALTNPDLFEKYVESFMEMHDRRQANDRAAYRLLLTDYVGANEDGSLPHLSDAKPCLRAVLLGYLKTGEVVQGNCRSCSRCVPKGDFEKDLSKRNKVVELLGTEILDLLAVLEMARLELPDISVLRALWSHVERLEAAGRSLRAYVEGWTGRLLTDLPNHKTALWIRIDGMVRGILSLQPQEACSRALEILGGASPVELETIWDSIALFQKTMPDMPEALRVSATACHRTGRFQEARELLQRILDLKPSPEVAHDAHVMLSDLFDSSGPFSSSELFRFHCLRAARTASEFTDTVALYTRAREKWQWEDICEELLIEIRKNGERVYEERLVAWWIDSQSDVKELAATAPPWTWTTIVDGVLSWFVQLEDGKSESKSLRQILADALDKWAVITLRQSPNLYPVRGLRIALITEGLPENLSVLATECLEFLKQASESERVWLHRQLKEGQCVADHFVKYLVQAEVAFQEGDYSTAITNLRKCIDTLQPDIHNNIASHVLERLIEIHRPQGGNPDEEGLYSALLARAKMSHSWSEAKPFYSELMQSWNASRLRDELRSNLIHKDPSWVIRVLALWSEIHDRAEDSIVILSILGNMDKRILDVNANSVETILRQAHPRDVASHSSFGPMRLLNVLHSERAIKKYNATTSNNCFEDRGTEFLVHAFLVGLFDAERALELNLPVCLFEETSDSVYALLTKECGPIAVEQALNDIHNIFFHEYQPKTTKALVKWMDWFASLIPSSGKAGRRVIEVVENVIKKMTLATSRTEIEMLVSMAEKHDVHNYNKYLALFRTFSFAVASVEKASDIAQVYKLEGYHFDSLVHILTDSQDHQHADILVALLRAIRKRTNPAWLTPLSYMIKALVLSGRTDEAAVLGKVPGLTIGRNRTPVDVLISEYKGKQRQAPVYDRTLGALADLYIKSWHFE
ncbi:hypothetical protein JCM31598_43210 [Desulfonatronum parangueonense]